MAYSIQTTVSFEEITVNKQGDKIYISADDSALFDRFVNGFKNIMERAKKYDEDMMEIEKKYEGKEDIESDIEKTVEVSRVNMAFSEDGKRTIDSIFGDGITGKYFREIYEKIPDFTPGVNCFLDFFEEISPAMEQIFDREIDKRSELEREREKARKARMEKYKPQDHRRPGGK